MEVFGARLDQEYGANVILTQPSVEYRAIIKVYLFLLLFPYFIYRTVKE